jgi:putative protein-disulfide isomerase
MIFAIQQAYYLQAKNPSDNSILRTLAEQIGLEKDAFNGQLSAPLTQQKLMTEIEKTRSLPIQGFPSLVFTINGQDHAIPLDYQQWKSSFEVIKQILSNK